MAVSSRACLLTVLLMVGTGCDAGSPDGPPTPFVGSVPPEGGGFPGLVRVSTTGEVTPLFSFDDDEAEAPTCSPDGRRIAFESFRDADGYGRPALWYLEDGRARPLGRTAEGGLVGGRLGSWAPDGRRIAVTLTDGSKYGPRTGELALIDAHARTVTPLTNGPAIDEHPAWTRDGQWIAFSSSQDRYTEVFALRPDGTGLRPLSALRDTSLYVSDVTPGPGASEVTVQAYRIGPEQEVSWRLWIVDAATGAERPFPLPALREGAQAYGIDWRADGSAYTFAIRQYADGLFTIVLGLYEVASSQTTVIQEASSSGRPPRIPVDVAWCPASGTSGP